MTIWLWKATQVPSLLVLGLTCCWPMRFCPGAGLDVPGKSFRASNCWNSLRGKYRNKCIGLIFHWTDVSLERTAPHTTHLAGKSIGDWWGQSDSDCQLAMYLQSKQMHQKLILYKACFWFVLFFFLFFSGRLGLCPITFLQEKGTLLQELAACSCNNHRGAPGGLTYGV